MSKLAGAWYGGEQSGNPGVCVCACVLTGVCGLLCCAAESLKDYFGTYGEIVEVSVKVDPVTKRRRGFGFLTFKERESVDQVLRDKERGHVVDGKAVGVVLSQGRGLAKGVVVDLTCFLSEGRPKDSCS